jgi:hypothetical protein
LTFSAQEFIFVFSLYYQAKYYARKQQRRSVNNPSPCSSFFAGCRARLASQRHTVRKFFTKLMDFPIPIYHQLRDYGT